MIMFKEKMVSINELQRIFHQVPHRTASKGKDIYHHVFIVNTNKVQHIEKRIIGSVKGSKYS